MLTFANRASAVLCNFLKSQKICKPFILPANVCPVVPLSFLKAGVDFEFVDIDESHALDKEFALGKLYKGDYAGVLFVHAYGNRFDNESFYGQIKSIDNSLLIIDDCCLCEPDTSDYMEDNIDLQLFSTGYAKYIELSYGGYGKTRWGVVNFEYQYDSEVEVRQQQYIKKCFKERTRYALDPDLNWLDGSPLKMTQEEYFGIINAKRDKVKRDKEAINKIYRDNLPMSIQMGNDFQNWRFMLQVDNRDRVLDDIFDEGLFAGTNFPSVSYMFKGTSAPRSEYDANHIINLFNDFRINEEQAYKICKIINTNI